jgi:hypothetical protein
MEYKFKNENLDANPVSCMASKTSDSERLAATEKRQEELLRYLELFAGAFDELHGAIMKQVNTPGRYIGPHRDYPVMSLPDGGFPSFHEAGSYRDSSPRDYVGMLRPRGLAGLLGGGDRAS